MATVETMLVLGALIIFSIMTLTLNDVRLDTDHTLMAGELQLTAVSMAHDLFEQAQNLAYDEVLTDSSFAGWLPDDLTGPDNLGPDSGELYPAFDDVDDFHNYNAEWLTPRGSYQVQVAVQYADTGATGPQDSTSTLVKIMSVNIASEFYADTLRMHYMLGYR
jgi:hypothetical protein